MVVAVENVEAGRVGVVEVEGVGVEVEDPEQKGEEGRGYEEGGGAVGGVGDVEEAEEGFGFEFGFEVRGGGGGGGAGD